MRTFRDTGDLALETRCNDMLLGRLGRELATVYHDTLDQPLPAALRQLTERLESPRGIVQPCLGAGDDQV